MVASPPPKKTLRNALIFGLKVSFAVLLVGWLVRSGNLDARALGIFIERPGLLALDLALFTFGTFIASLRFKVLLRIAKVDFSLAKLFLLQLTAFFFNTVIPGNIGGDVVKGIYVAREAKAATRTTVLLLVFVERLLGVTALIFMGTIVALLGGTKLWANPLLRPLASAVVGLGAALLIGGLLALLVVRKAGHRLDAFTSGPSKISKLLNQLVASMRLVSQGPGAIAIALLLSMSYHAAGMGLFTVLTEAILGQDVPYSSVATVFPLGLLSLMLPISPSGLGVGHVAFKRLFEAIGLAGGATVFNVYLLGQIAPCLTGVFPFLMLRRRGELSTEAPVETGEAPASVPPSDQRT